MFDHKYNWKRGTERSSQHSQRMCTCQSQKTHNNCHSTYTHRWSCSQCTHWHARTQAAGIERYIREQRKQNLGTELRSRCLQTISNQSVLHKQDSWSRHSTSLRLCTVIVCWRMCCLCTVRDCTSTCAKNSTSDSLQHSHKSNSLWRCRAAVRRKW